jgi:aspartate/methionine/tyrosine aminotransferase
MNSHPEGYVKPFIVMDVLERAISLERGGRSIIHMEIGEPDFTTPRRIIEAGKEALSRGETHYTDSRGIIELRANVAAYYRRRYNVDVTEQQVLITMGVSPALLLVMSILIQEPGDEIILSNPHYPCYPNFIRYLKGQPRFVATRAENGFQLKSDDVRKLIGPRTRAILMNSPSNPAGTLIPREDIEAICSLGVPVISDEIYHGLVYGDREHTTLEFTKDTFVLNGFSKLFAMTGWRLGYIIAPVKAVRQLHVLLQNFFICPNAFVQWAAVSALTDSHPEIDEMIKKYDIRRRYLLEELPKLGLNIPVEPKGAFYFFVNTKHIDGDSFRLAFDILEKAGVALTPGIDFGERGEGHLRISYANSLENIAEGTRRLKTYFEQRGAL